MGSLVTKLTFVTKKHKKNTFCDDEMSIGDGKEFVAEEVSIILSFYNFSFLFQLTSSHLKAFLFRLHQRRTWRNPFVTNLTEPVRDEPDGTHLWRSRWFPFAMTSTIPIPIGDDPRRFQFPFVTILDDSWRFRPFMTILGDSDHLWRSRSRHHRFGAFATISKSSPPSNNPSPPTAHRFASHL